MEVVIQWLSHVVWTLTMFSFGVRDSMAEKTGDERQKQGQEERSCIQDLKKSSWKQNRKFLPLVSVVYTLQVWKWNCSQGHENIWKRRMLLPLLLLITTHMHFLYISKKYFISSENLTCRNIVALLQKKVWLVRSLSKSKITGSVIVRHGLWLYM